MMVATRYVQLADLKSRLGISVTTYDSALTQQIEAAERLIDRLTGRTFDEESPATPVARTFKARSPRYCLIDDVIDIDTVSVSYDGASGSFTAMTVADLVQHAILGGPVHMIESELDLFPTGRRGWVKVLPTTGWGWSSAPEDIQEAVLLHASKLAKRKDSVEGSIGFDGAGVTSVRKGLDDDAKALVWPYRKVSAWLP